VAGGLIILVGALQQVHPALDPDLGWHLRTGQLILSSHGIPRLDTFSHTLAGQPWADFEWLWEAALAAFYSATGMLGPIIAGSLLTGVVYTLVYVTLRLKGVQPLIAALGVAFTVANLVPYANLRPGMAGAAFIAGFILVLELSHVRDDRRWLLLLFPAEIAWANIHGSFILGPAICGLYGLAAVWEPRSYGAGSNGLRRIAALWGSLTGGLMAVSLANPMGLNLIPFTLAASRLQANRDYNLEWAAPNFHSLGFVPLLATTLLLLALPLLFQRVRPSKAEALLLLATTLAVLQNSQFTAFYAVAAAPLVARMLNQLLNRPLHTRLSPAVGVLFAATLTLTGVQAGRSLLPTAYAATMAKHYPVDAVAYVEQNQLEGPLWNDFNWGSYLISALPRLPVFIDGRTEMYGDLFFNQYYDVSIGAAPPEETLDRYGINLVLMRKGSAMVTMLSQNSQWSQVFQDEQASVFVRTGRQADASATTT